MNPNNSPKQGSTQNTERLETIEQSTQVLLALITHQWAQAKQSEDQRSATTNFIITVAIALQGFIVQRGFDTFSVVLAVLISLLGVFGMITSAKYYERFRSSTNRIGEMSKYLDQLYPLARARELQRIADLEHQQRFPRVSQLRLNQLWIILHALVVTFGLANIIVILIIS